MFDSLGFSVWSWGLHFLRPIVEEQMMLQVDSSAPSLLWSAGHWEHFSAGNGDQALVALRFLYLYLRHTAHSRYSVRNNCWYTSLSVCVCVCMCVCLVAKSCPTLATPWTVTHQAPLSMGFPRQESWSGLSFPSPGDLPDLGIEPRSPALQADSLPTELWGNSVLPGYLFGVIVYHAGGVRIGKVIKMT